MPYFQVRDMLSNIYSTQVTQFLAGIAKTFICASIEVNIAACFGVDHENGIIGFIHHPSELEQNFLRMFVVI